MAKLKAFKYSITPEVTAQYDEMGRVGIYALNELNQYMQTAKKAKSTAEHHVYTHAKSGLTMYLQRKYNVIDRIELTEQPFAKTVTFTKHAIERIMERLEQPELNAENYVRQILSSATYHGVSHNYEGPCDIYVHKKSGVTIVIDAVKSCVVTVYKADEPTQSIAKITIDRIANAVQREFNRMSTQYRREIRKMSEQQARLNVQVAQLELNFIRCKNPINKESIQTKIQALSEEIQATLKSIKHLTDELTIAKTESEQILKVGIK